MASCNIERKALSTEDQALYKSDGIDAVIASIQADHKAFNYAGKTDLPPVWEAKVVKKEVVKKAVKKKRAKKTSEAKTKADLTPDELTTYNSSVRYDTLMKDVDAEEADRLALESINFKRRMDEAVAEKKAQASQATVNEHKGKLNTYGIQQELMDAYGDKFTNVFVVDTFNELPQHAQDAYKEDGNPKALFIPPMDANSNKAEIYLIADQIVPGDVKGIILHEKGVHEYLQNSKEFQKYVDIIKNSNSAEAKRARDHVATLDLDEEQSDREIVAYYMEQDPKLKTGWIETVRKWLYDKFGFFMSENDVISMTNSMVDKDTGTTDVTPDVIAQASTADYLSQANTTRPSMFSSMEAAQKQWGHIAGNVNEGVSQHLLGFMPQQHLLNRGELLGMTKIGDLQHLVMEQNAKSDQLIQKAIDTVRDPLAKLYKADPKSVNTMSRLFHNATKNQKDYKELRAFKDLPKAAQDIAIKIEELHKDQGRVLASALQANVDAFKGDSSIKAEYQGYINTLKHNIEDTIYFPMQRFGDFRVQATTPDGELYVSRVDNKMQMLEEVESLERQGYTDLNFGRADPVAQEAKSVMTDKAFAAANALVEQMGGTDDDKSVLWGVLMRLNKPSQLKGRMKRRRMVAGASSDLLRGVETNIRSVYKDAIRREFAPKRQKLLEEARIQTDGIADNKTKAEAQDIVREIEKREETITRSKFATELIKTNFLFHLGFNASSALVNLTQNAIVGVPLIGAKYGYTRTATQLLRGLKDYAKHPKDVLASFEGEERLAIQRLIEFGTINNTQANMHRDLADGNDMGSTGVYDKTVELSALMFHHAEVANRVASSMAVFRMAREDGMDFNEAVEEAHKKTLDVHFDYSEEGKSRYQRGNIGGVLLAFKSYPIAMAALMGSRAKMWLAESDLSPEQKKQARNELLGVLAMTGTIGGALALPTASAIMMIADMLLDDDEDAMEELRKGLVLNLGEDGANVFMYGLFSTLTDIDLSSRVSLDKMFLEIPQGEATADQWFDNINKSLLGPIGGMYKDIPKGLSLMSQGKEVQGAERMAPTAVANLSKALRWGEQGSAYNTYDDMVEREFSTLDMIKRAGGLGSIDYAEGNRALWTGKRVEREAKSEISRMKRLWAMAKINGDRDTMRDVRSDVRDWNAAHPDRKISMRTLNKKYKDLNKKMFPDETAAEATVNEIEEMNLMNGEY